jgi:hypothetical protein
MIKKTLKKSLNIIDDSIKKTNKYGTDMLGVLIVFLMLGCLIWVLKNKYIEKFIVLIDEVVIPKECPDYLVTNGVHYYLIDSRKVLDGVNNPMKFDSKEAAESYLDVNKCPKLVPINLVVDKDPTDVTVNYERECAKKVATQLFNTDVCGTYSDDTQLENLRTYTNALSNLKEKANQIMNQINSQKLQSGNIEPKKKELFRVNMEIQSLKEKYKQIPNSLEELHDFNIESCMIDTIKSRNNKLNDDKFLNEFSRYFNNLNENIGQEFLYV